MSFETIPVLDLALSNDPETKPAFLTSLRNALLDVGFLYITNTGIPESLTQDVMREGKAFFQLPMEKKLEIQMKNVPSFLGMYPRPTSLLTLRQRLIPSTGYNTLGSEITAQATDWREQIDLSTPHPLPSATDPLYQNLRAPNQWPDPTLLPSFRPIYEQYIQLMSTLSQRFTSLIAESLHLPAEGFSRFFDEDQQHKLKIVRYPDAAALPTTTTTTSASKSTGNSKEKVLNQGVGPHKDSMLTSYLLQVPPHTGLQAQNLHGEWIDCPPQPGTLVVAIGQGLEALTHGVCKSTTHRVLSPEAGLGPRYSIPFFQGVSYGATFEAVDVPAEIIALKEERDRAREGEIGGGRRDDVEFTFRKGRWGHLGEATLSNRVKSHPDVGERWYPDILAGIRRDQAEERRRKEEANDVGQTTQRDGVASGIEGGRQDVEVY